jgi:phosphatidylglycerophosphate synthase
MGEYQPASRRPIAAPFRATANAAVRVCVRRGVHPDVVSYASVAAAAGAAGCFLFGARWPALLLAGAGLCVLRLWFNMLDGMVALASGRASLRGEIVNELPDRVSDVLIFVGVAHSGLANPFLGYWAAILALVTAYVGTLAQAVTGRRRFEGVMSKQYRMAVVCAGAIVAFFVRSGWAVSALDWACATVIAGCVQTVVIRLAHTMRDLKAAAGVRRPN